MCREECEAESVTSSQVVVTGSIELRSHLSCHMCWVNIQSEWVMAGTPGVTLRDGSERNSPVSYDMM